MRAVVQRVSSASVTVEGRTVGFINRGFLVLVSAAAADSEADLEWTAQKILGLRVFPDSAGKMNLSLAEVDGELLVISQFTLHGDCRKGKRPSFIAAMEPVKAEEYYNRFVNILKKEARRVETGIFGADMQVSLVNEGPVTLLIDSAKLF